MHEANALTPNTKAMMQNATAKHSITNTSLKAEQRQDPDGVMGLLIMPILPIRIRPVPNSISGANRKDYGGRVLLSKQMRFVMLSSE